jgi:ParB/RepB/Spo0J family partition protein
MVRQVEIEKIDDSLSKLRLTRPEQIKKMEMSLGQVGQLHAVIARDKSGLYQLLDGFKRHYAALALGWDKLKVQLIQADDITAKTMILNYNETGSSLLDYEEAQIVYSLKTDHGLNQKQISELLKRSASWVSRRVGFIEKLDEGVRTQLQLGQITLTHARDLIKLPRGKQGKFLKLIIRNHLTSRQSSVLVSKYLQSKTKEAGEYVLTNPMEVIEREMHASQIHDSRLGIHGNRLLISSRLLAHQQHIFIGQSTNPPLGELPQTELEILTEGFTDIIKKAKMIQSILTKDLCMSDER